jgi:catechol 2,3-dioxygenase-like lactoylglutathione lyase family enzyme
LQIREIEICTANLLQTEVFYTEVLGLDVKARSENKISFTAGRSVLTFIASATEQVYHFAFNIPHNKLDEALVWVSARAELIKNPDNSFITDFANWQAKAFYFYDNNGNILELIARFGLKSSSDSPFGQASFQCISEIGVVTDQPLTLAESLLDNNAVRYFSKGPRREDFVVLGDDHGLIIISGTHRNWYPTETRAEKNYVKIKIMSGDSERQIVLNEK